MLVQLPKSSDSALETFLATAPISANVAIGTGSSSSRRLTLEQDGRRLDALFNTVDSHQGLESIDPWIKRDDEQSERYGYEIAAYRLDRMLDVHLVPVTVERVIDGIPGMVQLWIENTINERDRIEQGISFTGFCSQHTQYRLRAIFDVLIDNVDRDPSNIVWTRDDFRLLSIDHSRAFHASTQWPAEYRKQAIELPELMRQRLAALNEAQLSELLGSYLHARQITAILKRRDTILKRAKRTGFQNN